MVSEKEGSKSPRKDNESGSGTEAEEENEEVFVVEKVGYCCSP